MYFSLRDFEFGSEALHLKMSIGDWATDGLLAIFFFVAGLELKHELTHGSLKEFRLAVVPIAAALGGMIVPALLYVLINIQSGGDLTGWAIPMATDIAFALGVLSIVGRGLPVALRAFLLTLAVVDDLGAITVIALFFTDSLNFLYLIGGVISLWVFWLLQKKHKTRWFWVLPVALLAWGLFHASGVHATVAGIALGLLVPSGEDSDRTESVSRRYEKFLLPISAGVSLPLFAFFATGVSFANIEIGDVVTSPISLGIIAGLFIGKPLGIMGGTLLATKLTSAELNHELNWGHIFGISVLSGVGFTVSLLISKLAFSDATASADIAIVAILLSSTAAALVAVGFLHKKASV